MAAVPPVKIHRHREVSLTRLRNDQPQFVLDLHRILSIDEPKPVCDPRKMGIHYDRRKPVDNTANNICTLATHPWYGCEVLHRFRQPAAILLANPPGRGNDVLGLASEEAGAMNYLFNLDAICIRKFLGIGVSSKQVRRDGVYL